MLFFNNINNISHIKLGKWQGQEGFLNKEYNDICVRLIQFILESGIDEYNRNFLAEPIINFAIENNITECSIVYIYRHYVYSKLSEYEYLDIENAYLEDLMQEFIILENN